MRGRLATDGELQRRIQRLWLPLFGGMPKPSVFTQEKWNQMMSDGWNSNLARLKKAVSSITARGGKVIFQRLPSTGGVLELETRLNPRAQFWDRILEETGAPGIYFEDFPELTGFSCPEWSHLNAHDATEYTRRFARILRAKHWL
jgi:hypothetical protein